MKYFVLLILFSSNIVMHSQNFEKEWKEIENLIQKQLPKSAYEKTTMIFEKAISTNDQEQILKSIFYLQSLHAQLDELEYDSRSEKQIKYIEEKLPRVNGGAHAMLLSFLAERYASHLSQRYWQIKDKTKANKTSIEDINQWSVSDFEQKILTLYLESIKDSNIKNIPLTQYSQLVTNANSSYVKTLYDFLIRRAIEALSDERNHMTDVERKFRLKTEDLTDMDIFLKRTISIGDSSTTKKHVLALYQRLLKEHRNDADPKMLIDIDLQRLQFFYNNIDERSKDNQYRIALKNLYSNFANHDEAFHALLAMGQSLQNTSHSYKSNSDTTEKWSLKEAVNTYRLIVEKCKDRNLVHQALNYRNNILQNISFQAEVEKIYLPEKPLLMKLTHTNLSKLYYRIYASNLSLSDRTSIHSQHNNKRFLDIFKTKLLKSGMIALKDIGDYRSHSTEFDLEALPIGHYYIVISKEEDFNTSANYLGAASFSVSNLAYFTHSSPHTDKIEIFVVSRNNGQPIPDAEVEIYHRYYEQQQKIKKVNTLKSDRDGLVSLTTPVNVNSNFFFVIKKAGDEYLELQDQYFYYDGYQNVEHTNEQYQIFLDREIYRPGQTIYFKGIAMTQSNKSRPKIQAIKKLRISFKDANWQDTEVKELVTNEYGTFHGQFTAPKTGLLGVMHISVADIFHKPLRVEEYKRPSFEIILDTMSEAIKLNDLVSITGGGKAYSGANIPNANYRYRVTRETRYPYWKCWWMPRPNDQEQVAEGDGRTDDQGKFVIAFKAIPGDESPWDKNPIFYFKIHVEMTDLTGETQHGETQVGIGTIDFQISADVKSSYTYSDALDIPVKIENLNGQKIAKDFEVKIEQLKEPGIVFQSRFWSLPDYKLLSRADFKSKFPLIAYDQEDRKENYPVLTTIVSERKNSGTISMVSYESKTWKAGTYKMIISAKDNQGKPISIERFFTLHGHQANPNNILSVSNIKSSYDRGDRLNIKLSPSQKNQKVWSKLVRQQDVNNWKWNEGSDIFIEAGVEEKDRGGMLLHALTIWNNRFYHLNEQISVPWSNKELDITYESFRDKMQPGAQEEFRLRIRGKKGDKIMAEVLANMYDQSLDVFEVNRYTLWPYSDFIDQTRIHTNAFTASSIEHLISNLKREKYFEYKVKEYPRLLFPDRFNYHVDGIRLSKSLSAAPSAMKRKGDIESESEAVMEMADQGIGLSASASIGNSNQANKSNDQEKDSKDQKSAPIKVRSNLNETVFFYPDLKTDADGSVLIKFKMNEALTKWKFMALATTKDLQIGYSERSVQTQKELMIQPNQPRFLREGDEVYFSAKVTNLSTKKLNGSAWLELTNAETMKSVNEAFGLMTTQSFYDIEAGQTKAIEWKLKVPSNISALSYRVLTKAGEYGDGEANALPILSNRMLVTETMPFYLKANAKKDFTFREMDEKIKSATLLSKRFTIEYTANPVWCAIQSLPYLMEYPYECTEQIMNRYFANTLSSHIVNKFPKIQSVLNSWKESKESMLSNLSKNQSLKSALLEETPWVMQAKNEEEQRANIAILFDLNRIAQEEESAISKLHERQAADGSYPWFPGGYINPYITQYVMEVFGHLSYLGIKDYESNHKVQEIMIRGIQFIDQEIIRHYEKMRENVKRYGGKLSDDHLDPYAIHYLYTRSYFENEIPSATKKVMVYYQGQARTYWNNRSIYQQGMIALHFHRNKQDSKLTMAMMKSFRERAKTNDEKGMYWDTDHGYWWYQLPIETHSLMTEVFEEMSNDQVEKDHLKLWLLKNKQTNRWETTKSTSSAIYALLGGKNDQLNLPSVPVITIGNEKLQIAENSAEAVTGYIQRTWADEDIKPGFSKIQVQNPNPNVAWGAVYWQYLEKLNAIQSNISTPLKVKKSLYVVRNSQGNEIMDEATADNIRIGDKVRVRLTIMVEREMEFLHLKDMRAAGFEPEEALSGYKWSGGLGYYQTVRDASMNFFIDHIDNGTYTIEYDLFTNLKGKYSNGITTFQSMYAPEFNSHSEGMEVEIR